MAEIIRVGDTYENSYLYDPFEIFPLLREFSHLLPDKDWESVMLRHIRVDLSGNSILEPPVRYYLLS